MQCHNILSLADDTLTDVLVKSYTRSTDVITVCKRFYNLLKVAATRAIITNPRGLARLQGMIQIHDVQLDRIGAKDSSFMLPPNVCLKKLHLLNASLHMLTSDVSMQLKHLEALTLSYCNNFTCLPASISQLTMLQLLNLVDCTTLLEGISHLSALQVLDLYNCVKLSSLPDSIGKLSALQTLNLRDLPLTFLPDSIGNLSALQSLDLSRNDVLTYLPKGISNLSTLEFLNLSFCCRLRSLPDGISNLSALQTLKLRTCPFLTSLPDSIGNLSALQSLDLSCCKALTDLPKGISNLSSLKHYENGLVTSVLRIYNERYGLNTDATLCYGGTPDELRMHP